MKNIMKNNMKNIMKDFRKKIWPKITAWLLVITFLASISLDTWTLESFAKSLGVESESTEEASEDSVEDASAESGADAESLDDGESVSGEEDAVPEETDGAAEDESAETKTAETSEDTAEDEGSILEDYSGEDRAEDDETALEEVTETSREESADDEDPGTVDEGETSGDKAAEEDGETVAEGAGSEESGPTAAVPEDTEAEETEAEEAAEETEAAEEAEAAEETEAEEVAEEAEAEEGVETEDDAGIAQAAELTEEEGLSAAAEETSDSTSLTTYYALIYDDGTMVFQPTGEADSEKTLSYTYTITSSTGSRPWSSSSVYQSITTVTFAEGYTYVAPSSLKEWFKSCSKLTVVYNAELLNTSNVTNMNGMFNGCSVLTSVDVGAWDTSNVTDMSYMFYNCVKLESLDVSSWDTSKVTNMGMMFARCSVLETLATSDWNTVKVTNFGQMFQNCSALTGLDVSEWDTSSVTGMYQMFSGCTSLTSLDVSGWNTSSVKTTGFFEMFGSCSSLVSLDVSGFDVTDAVTTLSGMFRGCSSLTDIGDVSGWNTSNVTTFGNMFSGCSSLLKLNIGSWDTSAVTSFGNMFTECSSLVSLVLSGWNTSSVTNMYQMFKSCTSLTSLDVSGWDTSNVTNFTDMFITCTSLETLDLSSFDTSAATAKTNMLYDLAALSTLKLGSTTDISGTGFSHLEYSWAQLSTAVAVTTTDDDGNEYTYTDYTMVKSSEIMELSADGSITTTDTFSREAAVNFYANGGTPSSSASIYSGVVYGQDITVVSPTRTGYTFAGWYTARTGGTKLEEGYSRTVYYDEDGNVLESSEGAASYETTVYTSDGTVSDAPLITQAIYYAHWTPSTYTLTLKANGGVGTDESGSAVTTLSISMDYGEFYSLSDAGFTYDGYVLSSWNTKRDGSGTSYSASASVGNLTTEDGGTITLYAQWTSASEYATVTFDVVGNYEEVVAGMEAAGDVGAAEDIDEITSKTVTVWDRLGLLSESTCDGLDFVRWIIILDEEISGHQTIISYVENLGDAYILRNTDYTYDDNGNLTEMVVYYYYNYTFTEDDVTYGWAVVRAVTTTYTYDEDGGESASDPVTQYYIEADQYTYVGSILLDSNNELRLTAVWTADVNIVVSFDDGIGGGTISQKKVQSGSAVGTLPEIADGYNGSMSFLGWYTAGQGTDGAEKVTEETVLTAVSDLLVETGDGDYSYAVTYYAWWGWKPVFDADGGKITSDTSVYAVQESSVYTFAIPGASRDGCTLSYWTLSDGTILYEGVTYASDGTVVYDGTTYESIGALQSAVADLEYAASGGSVTVDLSTWGRTVTAVWIEEESVTLNLDLTAGFISKETDGTVSVYSSDDYYTSYVEETSDYAADVSYDYSTKLTLYTTSTVSGLYTPTLSGYTFLGWALVGGNGGYLTDSDGGIIYVTNGTEVSDLSSYGTSPYTLRAVFAENQYTITFDPGDGTLYGSEIEDATVTMSVPAGAYTGSIPGASLSNYEFVGWYTLCGDGCTGIDVDTDSESFSGTKLVSGTTVISGDVTYHAHYESDYQTYTSSDGSVTFTYAVSWSNANTADVDNVDGNLDFHPTSGTSQTATLYIYFDILEGTVAEAGTVKIYIPKDVWGGYGTTNISSQLAAYYDSDGNILEAAGTFSYYEWTDPDTGEEYYVIINNTAVSAGFSVEISYTVNPLLLDGGAMDSEGNYIDGYEYYSAEVPVRITVGDIVDKEITLSLELHTDVNPTASKTFYAKYTSWDESWGEEPDDSEDYVYIVWKLRAEYNYNSQSVTYWWDEDSVHDGTIVKWLTQNSDKDFVPVYDEDGAELTGTTSLTRTLSSASGNSTDYLLIKYPAEYFTDTYLQENEGYEVENQTVLHSVWASGYEESQAVSASKSYAYTTSEESDTEEEEEEEGVLGMANKFYKYNTDEDVMYVSGAQEVLVNDEESVELEWIAYYSGGAKRNSWSVDESGNVTLPVRTITITDGNSEEMNLEDADDTGITTGDLIYSSGAETDRYLWEPGLGNVSLYDEDYEITSISFMVLEYSGTFSTSGTLSDISLINTLADYGAVKIYVRYEGTDEYVLYRKVAVTTAGSYATYQSVSLPSGTVGYKLEYETQQYGTKIYVKADVQINPTLHVQSLVGEDLTNDVTSIFKNIAHCTVDQTMTTGTTDEDGTVTETTVTTNVFDTDNYDGASESCEEVIYELDKSESEQYTRKYAASTGNVVYDANTSTQDSANYLVSWNYNLTDGRKTYMTSGVFYDLLPKGTSVDSSTVFGMVLTENMTTSDIYDRTSEYATLYAAWKSGDESYDFLNQGLYDVQFVDDWEDSGRTMMIITWAAPGDTKITGMQFWYQLHTTYTNLKLYGTSQVNDVAFVNTSENAAVPETLSGTQDVLEDEYSGYFNALYSASRSDDYGYSSKFITYAVSTVNYIPVSYNSWGFSKTVKGGSSEYTESDVTTPGGGYSYQMTYSLTGTTTISDIIFIDVLENGTDDAKTYWQGFFKSVDVSSISSVENYSSEGAFCNPVVYYSTLDREIFYTEGNSDSSTIVDSAYSSSSATYDGEAVWIERSLYSGDVSAVTAVMIDCTKDTSGSSFVLGVTGDEEQKSLSWVIYMTAPTSETYKSVFGDDDEYKDFADVYGLYATNEAFVFYTASNTSTSSSGSEAVTTSSSGYKEDPAQISLLDVDIEKESDPATGTEEDPTEVYESDAISYTLTVTNKNEAASISNVVVEDDNISDALTVDSLECRFYYSGEEPEADEDWIDLESSPRISYTTEASETSGDEEQSGTKYIFTINSLAAGEVVQIRINATANDLVSGEAVVHNVSAVTTVDGTVVDVESDETWHKIVPYELPETGSRTLVYLIIIAAGLFLIAVIYRRRPGGYGGTGGSGA